MDMWVYLPMVSLLIRAIVGNSEVDDTAVSSGTGLGNAYDALPNDNHTARSSIDLWKTSKRERNKREIDPNVTDEMKAKNDLLNSDKTVFKRRETMGLGFEKVPQERTSPWRWWQDEKRSVNNKPILSCECKLHQKYHRGFDSGGGKRGTVYASSIGSKRTKVNDNGDDRDEILNQFKGIKRQELRKTALSWDKWGGKRAEMSDRERILLFLRDPDVRVLNVIGDGLPKERAARIKDRILTMFGKRDSGFDTETGDDEQVNEIDDWLMKTDHEQYKKTFNQWGGKRSIRFWNDYVKCMMKTRKRNSHL